MLGHTGPMLYSFRFVALPCVAMLAACSGGGPDGAATPGDRSDTQPYAEIGAEEALRFTGTEPFWGGTVAGGTLTYTTPDNPDGWAVRVARFAGRNGISFTGSHDGRDVVLAATPGVCSDGMSDRRYPFYVTLRIAGETRTGCAWSSVHPFAGPGAGQ